MKRVEKKKMKRETAKCKRYTTVSKEAFSQLLFLDSFSQSIYTSNFLHVIIL